MATERYNPREAEPRWQARWADERIFETKNDDPRPKYYVLEMFPYPVGAHPHGPRAQLHAWATSSPASCAPGATTSSIPMGWDAFGLPAENAAMQNSINPRTWTYDNIAAMRDQLKMMGLSLDWSREFATCDPEYYAQQQKLFLDLLAKGLAYRRKSKVNWDPVDQTVLANEQVIDGRGWRSGAVGRAARADPVVLPDHRLQRRPARRPRHARPLAGEGAPDAAELDRQVRGHARPLSLRRRRRRAASTRSRSSPRAPTRCSARASWRSRPTIRWPTALAEDDAELRRFIDECHRTGTSAEAIETAEKMGYDTGLVGQASLPRRRRRCRSMSPTSC